MTNFLQVIWIKQHPAAGTLGFSLYDVSLAGAGASAALVEVFGGLENFTAATSRYYDLFYTDAEKLANTTGAVSEALAELGLSMPDTQEAYRAMVDQAKALNTELGDEMFATLVNLAPQMREIFDAAADGATAMSSASQIAAEATANTAAISEQSKLQIDAAMSTIRSAFASVGMTAPTTVEGITAAAGAMASMGAAGQAAAANIAGAVATIRAASAAAASAAASAQASAARASSAASKPVDTDKNGNPVNYGKYWTASDDKDYTKLTYEQIEHKLGAINASKGEKIPYNLAQAARSASGGGGGSSRSRASSAKSAREAAANAEASEFERLQRQLWQLQGCDDLIRAAEIDDLKSDRNRAIYDQIQALEKMTDALEGIEPSGYATRSEYEWARARAGNAPAEALAAEEAAKEEAKKAAEEAKQAAVETRDYMRNGLLTWMKMLRLMKEERIDRLTEDAA
ncbi:hypothetical protein [Paracoccus albus]|uniref:hypothetical protein n=1 Tax=Paracoccus albus TaxID=3017784 RepID=UPI0022F005F0|nr:hypothetical protein [Paracoccus albus]WBU61250.1 hypothetical protein PAF20_04910 [Paracoccus albus]